MPFTNSTIQIARKGVDVGQPRRVQLAFAADGGSTGPSGIPLQDRLLDADLTADYRSGDLVRIISLAGYATPPARVWSIQSVTHNPAPFPAVRCVLFGREV